MLKGLRRAALLAVLAFVALQAAPANAQVDYPGIPWSNLLPPLASPTDHKPFQVGRCHNAGLNCVSSTLHKLRVYRDRFGCDHRGVFATTYMTLTRVFRQLMKTEALSIKYKRYLYREDALFANFYFRVQRAWDRGDPIPDAWRIALETGEGGDYFGAQDMLLGINAHVQNDMPFVLASLGLRARDGSSRKPDHDEINKVLTHAYAPVVRAVRNRFDSSLDLTNPTQVFIDDAAGLEAVRGWREVVWRNAERLVNAKSPEERAQVAESIESYAAGWAQTIAAVPAPTYGATRDAYCQSQLAG